MPEELEHLKAHRSRKKIAREKLVQQVKTNLAAGQSLQSRGCMLPKLPRNTSGKCMRKLLLENPKR